MDDLAKLREQAKRYTPTWINMLWVLVPPAVTLVLLLMLRNPHLAYSVNRLILFTSLAVLAVACFMVVRLKKKLAQHRRIEIQGRIGLAASEQRKSRYDFGRFSIDDLRVFWLQMAWERGILCAIMIIGGAAVSEYLAIQLIRGAR